MKQAPSWAGLLRPFRHIWLHDRCHSAKSTNACFTNTVVALEVDSEVGVTTELRRSQAKMDAVMGHLGMEYDKGE